VNGLFYALLAIIVGVATVAFGGGGIQTARGYWERVSSRAEMKASEIRRQADPEGRSPTGRETCWHSGAGRGGMAQTNQIARTSGGRAPRSPATANKAR
jgi:hypothetical protein